MSADDEKLGLGGEIKASISKEGQEVEVREIYRVVPRYLKAKVKSKLYH